MAQETETPSAAPARDSEEAIRAYKQVLATVIDQRPSGTRQRLADGLGKNRSFVTQITSPAYSTPIPARHLPTIMSVCHFSPVERDHFLAAYDRAHPGKGPLPTGMPHTRQATLVLPDLGDDKLNGALDRAITDFAHRIAGLVGKGG